jgi:lysophospholipase L1-like esterase
LRDDLVSHFDSRAKQNFNLASSAGVYLHGIGGRTVDKVFQYDLPFLKSQHSDIIILELGTNNLSFLSPEAVGSRLEDLVSLLRDNLHVSVVALCQVIDRYLPHSQTPDTVFNTKAALLRQYLSVVLDNMPGVFLWEHRAFCKAGKNLLSLDGVHANPHGQFSLYKSYRGAILKALSLLR